MLNKKNIAKAMAAATVFTAAAPMATAFADVVDNSQTEEIKAIKNKVEKLINLTFTKNVNLLKTTGLAGEKVFDIKITGLNNNQAYTSYDAFEKDFDKAYASLEEGQKLEVVYNYAAPAGVTAPTAYTELEDGTVIDFVPSTYTSADLNKDFTTSKLDAAGNEIEVAAGTRVYTTLKDGSK